MSADVLAVLRAFAEDYRATIPKVYAQKRKKMKLVVAELDECIGEVEALIAERAARDAYAERYHWLRESSRWTVVSDAPMCFRCNAGNPIRWTDAVVGEELDTAIDAARVAENIRP